MPKKIELSIIVILFIFVFYCALTIGIPWDEGFEMTRGKERLKYIFSLGTYKFIGIIKVKSLPLVFTLL